MLGQEVRQPSVAGQFYPSDQIVLQEQLDRYLSQARLFYPFEKNKKPKILVSPHAGIIFSGHTAAYAYKQLMNKSYDRVILLGASHHMWLDRVVLDSHQRWQTPLGEVAVDAEATDVLTRATGFLLNKTPHLLEHSLEMQLVFLQRVLKNKFKIIPLLVGEVSDNLLEQVVPPLIRLLADKDTLLVISTDLSHYPPNTVADLVDSLTIESILTGKKQYFLETLSQLANLNLPLKTPACGSEALKLGLALAEQLSLSDWRYLNHTNSADFSGDKNSVVGYAALAAYTGKLDYKVEALQLARRSLEFYLKTNQKLTIKAKTKKLNQPGGVFVTLNQSLNQLRGCIGLIESRLPRYLGIIENAIAAGVSDPRFNPVSIGEVEKLIIEVSLLTQPRFIKKWQDIRLKKDGVVIEYQGRKGVFLPQVGERFANLSDFLETLCLQKVKAPSDCFKQKETRLFVFQAEEISEV